jgi:hypothetical protein
MTHENTYRDDMCDLLKLKKIYIRRAKNTGIERSKKNPIALEE